MHIVPVASTLALSRAAGMDPDRVEKDLQVLGPPLADHGEADPGVLVAAGAADGHVAIGLEDATEIGADLLMGRGPQAAGNADLRSAREKLPALDEVAEHLPVEADPPNLDLLRVGQTHLAMHIGQRDIEVLHHPGVLVVARDLELDGQRSIRPVLVLPDEAIGLQPAGECSLGAIDAGGLVESFEMIGSLEVSQGRTTCSHQCAVSDLCSVRMQMHPHAGLELIDAEPLRLGAPLRDSLDDVVGSGFDEAAVAELHAHHRLTTVGLDGDDPRNAVGVVDLPADLLALDELPDRNHAFGGGDERMVRLAGRALRASPRSRR